MEKTIHPIDPIYDKNSKILILGSFPSVLSRKEKFFYAHPQNRFWKVISSLLNQNLPTTIEEKKKLLLDGNIAIWDTIHSCKIKGSSDSSITNVIENDISIILNNSNIKQIFTNGKTSQKYYDKYIYPKIKIKAICLPSTSPANATYSLEKLIKSYSIILNYLTK